MTWRERIAAARERGRFTEEDRSMAFDWNTCAVGEVWVQHYGHKHLRYLDVFYRGHGKTNLGESFFLAVLQHKPDEAERILERVEDAALELKREAGS